MGAASSRYEDLSKNEYLEMFCGKEPIPVDDQFWVRFLTYNMRPPLTRNDQIELDSRLDSSCQKLLANNLTTGNIGSLIHQICLVRVQELLQMTDSEWQVNLFIQLFSFT